MIKIDELDFSVMIQLVEIDFFRFWVFFQDFLRVWKNKDMVLDVDNKAHEILQLVNKSKVFEGVLEFLIK